MKHKRKARILPVSLTPIGATNLYALARAIAWQNGDCFEWEQFRSKQKVLDTIEKYLGPYETLFDPMESPILYQGVLPTPMVKIGHPLQKDGRPDLWVVDNLIRDNVIRGALAKEGIETTDPAGTGEFSVIPSPDLKGPAVPVLARVTEIKRQISVPLGQRQLMTYNVSATGVGTESSSCTTAATTWGTCNGVTYTNVNTDNDILNEVVDDPVQGAVPDCFFIAAMSAWFWWKWPVAIPQYRPVTATIKPVLYDRNQGTPDLTVSSELALPTPNATRPVYASITPSNEIYPAILEKAYAKLRNCGDSALPSGAPIKNPEVSNLTGGDPLDALQALSNMQYTWVGGTAISDKPTAYYTKSPDPSDLIGLDSASNRTDFISRFSGKGKALYPMVAWTYYTGGNNQPPSPDRMRAPLNVRYVSDWLVANHAYSVLGAKLVDNNRYIILRNPFGPTYGGKPTMVGYPNYTLGIDTVYQDVYNWQPVSTSDYTLNIGQKQDGAAGKAKPDGIFALRFDQFRIYFEAVGWVV